MMEEKNYPLLDERLWQVTLPNGLDVCVIPRPGFSKKLAYFVTDFGAIHTEFTLDGTAHTVPAGIAHYLEHKLFDMPHRDVTAEFSALGAVPNAFTSYDLTAYYFSCTENFYKSLSLLLEFVSTPYFTEESVAKEQGIIGQEIDMHRDNPDARVFENLMAGMYRTHPIRIPILGDRESISRITPENLTLCHRAFYHPSNMLLCVIGDVDPEQICTLAEKQLPNTPSPQVSICRQWPETTDCPQASCREDMEVSMPMFQLGFKCEDPGRGAASIRQEFIGDLAAEALFGESSPLYLRLYQQGLIDSSFGGGFETVEGMAMLSASGDSPDPEAVQAAILEQAAVLAREGIDEETFLRMKRSTLGRRIRRLDSFDSTAFAVCACHFSGFDFFRFPEIYRTIQASDIQAFLQQTVTESRLSLSVIYPLQETEEETL